MEHLPFFVFALLPLGLLSWRKLPRSTACLLPLLAALAPVIAKGAMSLISHKQAGSAQKQAEEQKRLAAEQADKLARQEWDTQQNSPAAQAARYKNTLQLGRLAGAMGGMDKLPPSMRNYYQTQRTMPAYGGTSSYVATPKKGGGVWDFLGGVTDALGYLDTSKLGGGASAGLKAAGNTAAQAGGLGALQGGGVASSITDLTKRLRG